MADTEQTKIIVDFVDRFREIGIKSTGSQRTTYDGVLPNIVGSSTDPTIGSKNWREVLQSHNIDSDCYVTDPPPDRPGTSHPGFDVGGHMTTNSDGKVPYGGDSYLIPLCKWHNHPARNGEPFYLAENNVVLLSGYMQGELAASFIARLPSEERFAILYEDGDLWKNANIDQETAQAAERGELTEDILSCPVKNFVLMEKSSRKNEDYYMIRKHHVTN